MIQKIDKPDVNLYFDDLTQVMREQNVRRYIGQGINKLSLSRKLNLWTVGVGSMFEQNGEFYQCTEAESIFIETYPKYLYRASEEVNIQDMLINANCVQQDIGKFNSNIMCTDKKVYRISGNSATVYPSDFTNATSNMCCQNSTYWFFIGSYKTGGNFVKVLKSNNTSTSGAWNFVGGGKGIACNNTYVWTIQQWSNTSNPYVLKRIVISSNEVTDIATPTVSGAELDKIICTGTSGTGDVYYSYTNGAIYSLSGTTSTVYCTMSSQVLRFFVKDAKLHAVTSSGVYDISTSEPLKIAVCDFMIGSSEYKIADNKVFYKKYIAEGSLIDSTDTPVWDSVRQGYYYQQLRALAKLSLTSGIYRAQTLERIEDSEAQGIVSADSFIAFHKYPAGTYSYTVEVTGNYEVRGIGSGGGGGGYYITVGGIGYTAPNGQNGSAPTVKVNGTTKAWTQLHTGDANVTLGGGGRKVSFFGVFGGRAINNDTQSLSFVEPYNTSTYAGGGGSGGGYWISATSGQRGGIGGTGGLGGGAQTGSNEGKARGTGGTGGGVGVVYLALTAGDVLTITIPEGATHATHAGGILSGKGGDGAVRIEYKGV